MSHDIIKLIDRLAGPMLIPLLRRKKPVHGEFARSILLIRPGGIGDAVLLAPAIHSIKKTFPSLQIIVLAEQRNADVFPLISGVNEVFCYDRPWEFIKALRGRYDVVIDTEQWHRLSAVVACLTGAPMTIGYATNERQRLFSHPIPYSHDEYEVDSFCHLIEPLGIIVKVKELPFLNISDTAERKAESLLGKFSEKPFIVIFPGSSISEKRWDMGRFVKLASKLNQAGFPIIVIGSKEERAMGEEMTCGLDALNLAGKTSLVETAALIDKSSLLVSGDSGVLHIAVGLGKPTVSLFGASNIKKWAPRGDRHIVINSNLHCSPCTRFGYTPKCAKNAKCMADITVEEVVVAVEKLIGNYR